MKNSPEHLVATTTHARLGSIANAFRYKVDYVLIDPLSDDGPALFGKNRFNLIALHDRDHGGEIKSGNGVKWAIDQFTFAGLTGPFDVKLLTQPTFLGYLFNPVSFWLAFHRNELVAVIAEVNNTYGDRHNYICQLPEFEPIKYENTIEAKKLLHVSPFQNLCGNYKFNFHVSDENISIRIAHVDGNPGLIATLHGRRVPLSNQSILQMVVRRPLGALRTTILIHWQAFKLKMKGGRFNPRPTAPQTKVTKCSTQPNV